MTRKLKNEDKKAVNLIAHSNPKSPISEQYRLIRTNIRFASVDKEIKSIMVTSPEPSDGKSVTTANLAIVLAQQEKKVLIVDADLRKPSAHYLFNVSNNNGLTSLLTKKDSVEEVISKTYIPNLNILTSGPIPPNPSELLDSKAMETILEELKEMFEYVLFDTPPVLAVSDAQVLANKCDGVIMVVASGKTHRERAVKAKELLEKTNGQLLGVVVNGVESTFGGYYEYQ